MNKISKKIVSLVTMAAFALTLVPAAAFAADTYSSVQVAKNNDTVTIDVEDGYAEASVTLNVAGTDAGKNAAVWLTDASDSYYRNATVVTGNGVTSGTNQFTGAAIIADASGEYTVTFQIPQDGTYKVHAGIDMSAGQNTETPGELGPISAVSGADTITVNAAETYVDSITVDGAQTVPGQDGGTLTFSGVPNGVRSMNVVASVSSKYVDNTSGNPSSEGKIVSITNPYEDVLTITNADGEQTNEIEVDNENNAVFNVKPSANIGNGTYTLTLSADNATYMLSIKIGNVDTEADSIEVVDTGKTAVDKTTVQQYTNFDSVAQFTVKNADGDILTPGTVTSGFSAYNAGSSTADATENIGVLHAPEKGKNAVFKVVASTKNTDNFVLQLASAPSTLAVGEYTVRVSLDNGEFADVTFTVANFGKVVDTVIEFAEKDSGKVVTEVVDNETVYTATALQVDENGLTRPLTTASMGYNGNALVIDKNSPSNGVIEFTVNDDVDGNDNALVGSKIGVWAFTTAYGQYAYGEVTVVDEGNIENYTLEFDPTSGPAGEDNDVNVTVVDEDGDKVDVNNGNLYVYLLDKGDEDANVYVAPTTGSVNKGEGKITINSDKETDLQIIVGVRTSDNVIIANTLEYTVGAEDINADTTVVMTIGSSDYVVNNEMVTGDAAPYVDSAWRTMVPVRALAESFGADVEFNEEDQTVTIVDGDTTIVMTVGSEDYTINGEAAEAMDTAPVIGDGDRTYVPVRFVAEALGYTVTPLQDANGLTASVVFQK